MNRARDHRFGSIYTLACIWLRENSGAFARALLMQAVGVFLPAFLSAHLSWARSVRVCVNAVRR